MKKYLTEQEFQVKRKNRKIGFIAVLVVAVMAVVIWLAMDYFATESIITYRNITINGDSVTVILSEKTSSDTRSLSDSKNHIEPDNKDNHYGYFLEVYDSATNKSIDKIKFKSPVWSIQSTPELFVFPNGIIWVVSSCRYSNMDEHGFILKFEFKHGRISEKEFALDKKYEIRNTHENYVLISEGYDLTGDSWMPLSGNLYFDLQTEKIVDTRKKVE